MSVATARVAFSRGTWFTPARSKSQCGQNTIPIRNGSINDDAAGVTATGADFRPPAATSRTPLGRRRRRNASIRMLFRDSRATSPSSREAGYGYGYGCSYGCSTGVGDRLRLDGYSVGFARRIERLAGAVAVRASSASSDPDVTGSAEDEDNNGKMTVMATTPVTSAREAVERGLALYEKGRIKDALASFDEALSMRPNPEVAQAALYNKACCHAIRKENEAAAGALRTVLSKYNLSFSTILGDPDLEAFRATSTFAELRNQALAGDQTAGEGFRKDLKMMTEVQAPFRGLRLFLYLSLTAAASISTLFTIPRLITAMGSGEGASNLVPTLQNLGINLGGIALFAALYQWDRRKEEEQIRRIAREETLSRLQVRLSTGRNVDLVQLRGRTRPVILAGKEEAVSEAVKRASRFRKDLLERGVLLIPLIFGSGRGVSDKRKGFGLPPRPSIAAPANTDDFIEKAKAVTSKAVEELEKKFKAEPVSQQEWERWVLEQQEVTKGVQPGADVYIVLRLDGRVRRSGKGMPDWQEVVNGLPVLKAFISQLEK